MKRLILSVGLAVTAGLWSLPFCSAQVPAAPAAGQKLPKPIAGRITAKAEKSFDIEARKRGVAEQTKVNVEDATKFVKMEKGAAADITEGYTITVYGTKDGNKIAARGILRLVKVELGADRDLTRAYNQLVQPAGRLMGAQRGERPVTARVLSTNPITLKTREGNLEVTTTADTKVVLLTATTFADLPAARANVVVMPKAEPENNAVTARLVVQMLPAPRRNAAGAGAGK